MSKTDEERREQRAAWDLQNSEHMQRWDMVEKCWSAAAGASQQNSLQFAALSGIQKMFGQYGIASGHSSDIEMLFPEMVSPSPPHFPRHDAVCSIRMSGRAVQSFAERSLE